MATKYSIILIRECKGSMDIIHDTVIPFRVDKKNPATTVLRCKKLKKNMPQISPADFYTRPSYFGSRKQAIGYYDTDEDKIIPLSIMIKNDNEANKQVLYGEMKALELWRTQELRRNDYILKDKENFWTKNGLIIAAGIFFFIYALALYMMMYGFNEHIKTSTEYLKPIMDSLKEGVSLSQSLQQAVPKSPP